ncbi:hypothetical protein ANANG_G00018850 [Anguilla anguilla]|uniref:Uncharacterized protein n=1 Tax=Anguilla anguilla TaxID=7936 RepID=A0A9D3N1Z2_ANGAN|nr:hypothetical protein ANANG_G00018850 [Anguilla anguilla]
MPPERPVATEIDRADGPRRIFDPHPLAPARVFPLFFLMMFRFSCKQLNASPRSLCVSPESRGAGGEEPSVWSCSGGGDR